VKISSLHISAFGKLQELNLSFTDGMNMYLGDNEYGKSTILSFLRAMFYGFSQRGSGSARLKDNDRRKFIPWNGKSVGGSIEFVHEEKKYLLEKSFLKRKSDDITSLTLLPSGRRIDIGQKDVGEALFQISEEEFINTVFIGQLSSNIMDKETGDVSSRLANLAGTGTEIFSHDEIRNRLTSAAAKLQALRGSGGLIPRLEEDLNSLADQEKRMETALEQSEGLYAEITQSSEKEQRLQSELVLILQKTDALKQQGESLQKQMQEHEMLVQTALQRTRMAQEQDASRKELEKTNREHMQQREALRMQLTAEMAGIENEILRLHKEKQEDHARTDDLFTGLDAMLRSQELKCRESRSILEQKTSETSHLEEEILTISADLKPLLKTRSEIQKGYTMLLGRLQNARGYIIMLLLIFALTMVLLFVTHHPVNLVGIVFLFLAAGIFAANRMQLRGLDRKIVFLSKDHEGKMALFESGSAALYHAESSLRDEEMRQSDLLLQKKRLLEDAQKDDKNRDYVLHMTIEHRDTCKNRLEQLQEAAPAAKPDNMDAAYGSSPTDPTAENSGQQNVPDAAAVRYSEEQIPLLKSGSAALRLTISDELGRAEAYRTEISACQVDSARKETSRENLLAQIPDRSAIEEQRAVLQDRLAAAKAYHLALAAAQNVLDEAFSEMENVFAPQVNERAGAYLAKLTDGMYSTIRVDRSFFAELASEGDYAFHPVDYFSGGTADQVYLALRLAISDLVQTSDDKMPLLLDDAFIQYDDRRAKCALRLLRELAGSRQIILFTCHHRMIDMNDDVQMNEG